MRLLVITNLFYPDRGGGASVFSDLCFGLQARGWEVTVFTTHPYYPEWRCKSEGSRWRIQEETIRRVRVFRHGLYLPKNPSRLITRIFYELSFGISLVRSLFRAGRFDVVMVYCPMPGAVMFAALRKLLRKEPLWLNVQDIPADAAAASGISQSGLFNRMASSAQRFLFNWADVWSTISPVMAERLATLRNRNQPLHLCPNWLNGSLADCVKALPSKSGRLPSSPIKLLYAGNIGKKQGLLEFCQHLSKSSMRFEFLVHGNGGEAAVISKWVSESNDPRFRFGGFLDELSFARALQDTDIFVITEKLGAGASFIPSKLIPCIASGTPILAICDRSGPLGREMNMAGLGVVVEWSELLGIESKIDQLTRDFLSCQQRCLAHAKNYTSEVAIARFDTLLREMITGDAG